MGVWKKGLRKSLNFRLQRVVTLPPIDWRTQRGVKGTAVPQLHLQNIFVGLLCVCTKLLSIAQALLIGLLTKS